MMSTRYACPRRERLGKIKLLKYWMFFSKVMKVILLPEFAIKHPSNHPPRLARGVILVYAYQILKSVSV